ncbi:hypothetical protein EDB92DRAFT_1803926 [Lactarius akahatsu]|uniref:Protein kinase domain-containing protein n=1 Tax=Lactarius akahatsu TaxID=416441 RepID=A0AAD4L9R1_9AGAM|nr:hypothetical protein EDB92DRAFT_1803926 [Lactarius akahatsu]
MIVNCGGGLSALAAENRAENKIGTGGHDPLKRCTTFFRSYYAREGMKPIRDHCCCPTYLIALAGHWICILGAVFVDDVVVQPLTDFIWIGGYSCSDDRLKSMTRILASLGAGIAELRQFYMNLSFHDSQEDPQRFYPFIRQYTLGGQVVKFSYQDYLTQKTPEHAKAMFLATTETEDGREPRRQIVVKFVERYNAEAHRLLATAGLAPEIFYSPTEHPDLAGLTMVVMEFVDGKTACQLYSSLRLPPSISDQLKKALEILHENNFVFGDFRHPNIMITKDDRVRLIDFDWCGVHGEDTYPASLNDNRDEANGINWHPGVERGGEMMKEHDSFMLEGMTPRFVRPPATAPISDARLGKRKARALDDEEDETIRNKG